MDNNIENDCGYCKYQNKNLVLIDSMTDVKHRENCKFDDNGKTTSFSTLYFNDEEPFEKLFNFFKYELLKYQLLDIYKNVKLTGNIYVNIPKFLGEWFSLLDRKDRKQLEWTFYSDEGEFVYNDTIDQFDFLLNISDEYNLDILKLSYDIDTKDYDKHVLIKDVFDTESTYCIINDIFETHTFRSIDVFNTDMNNFIDKYVEEIEFIIKTENELKDFRDLIKLIKQYIEIEVRCMKVAKYQYGIIDNAGVLAYTRLELFRELIGDDEDEIIEALED